MSGKIPKNQNFIRFSRVSKFKSESKLFSNQLRICLTEKHSKKRWTIVSDGTGPLFVVEQKKQPAALLGM